MEPKIITADNHDFYLTFNNEGSKGYNKRGSGLVAEIQKFNDDTWLFQSNKSDND